MHLTIPVEPDADEARRWATEEPRQVRVSDGALDVARLDLPLDSGLHQRLR
ncbi:hypothetical protein [Demequina litorisediminis]|uniref:hypothetical protein n=1 Tax=Demequina litorisediminis TaxID=1849022 RepID=UPI0024E17856|nr:hypothetical protein [Demequina litorisediminis]